MTSPFADRNWTSPDGLSLHYRDYAADSDLTPVICMHGLTRNARDFGPLAVHLQASGRRVLVPEMRGRGDSEYAKDAATYTPAHYVGDVMALLADQAISKFVAIGTSLGGLMTFMLNAAKPGLVTAAVLNDIGPEVAPGGIERIRGYVGQGRSYPTWMHAARSMEEVHGHAHPSFDTERWLDMAKRTMVLCQNGRISFDYDMAIAEPFKDIDNAVPPDLWPLFDAMAPVPTLLVRGGLSELLSEETAQKMARHHPNLTTLVIPDAGHAPTLEEPESMVAIDALLARVG